MSSPNLDFGGLTVPSRRVGWAQLGWGSPSGATPGTGEARCRCVAWGDQPLSLSVFSCIRQPLLGALVKSAGNP